MNNISVVAANKIAASSEYSVSVSYTHLDVYKRQTYSYCNSFGFHLYTIVIQPPIHIPCGMSGSQNNKMCIRDRMCLWRYLYMVLCV